MKRLQKLNNTANLMLLIYPTNYNDYDVIVVGSFHILEQLSHKIEHSDLIKSSKFGGISVLVLDTADTLKGAMSCLKAYKKKYEMP